MLYTVLWYTQFDAWKLAYPQANADNRMPYALAIPFLIGVGNKNGYSFQLNSMLGPLFGLHPVSPDVAVKHYASQISDPRSISQIGGNIRDLIRDLPGYHVSIFNASLIL